MISRARQRRNTPLYVVAIGAITNVVSAILTEPDIRDNIVVLWLGGHPLGWRHTNEFNLQGDPTASRLLFDCGVPVVPFPCINVAEALTNSPILTRDLTWGHDINRHPVRVVTRIRRDGVFPDLFGKLNL